MGLKARDVLEASWDAIHALESGEWLRWESHWRSAVASLRSVYHTLLNIDKSQSKDHAAIIDKRMKLLNDESNSDHIVWVIKEMRDALLKENDGLPECRREVYEDDVILELTLPDGSDGLELLRDAAKWWEAELDIIEAELDD